MNQQTSVTVSNYRYTRDRRRSDRSFWKSVRRLTLRRECSKVPAINCFRIIGVPEPFLDPIIPAAFDKARRLWIPASSEARERGNHELEIAINVAWQRLKDWKCPVCGGVKKESYRETCGQKCSDEKVRRERQMDRGTIAVDFQIPDRATATMASAVKALRIAMIIDAMDRCQQCVSYAAKNLGIGRKALAKWIRIYDLKQPRSNSNLKAA